MARSVSVDGSLGLATALTWVIVAAFMRYSSLAALMAAVFAPVYYLFGDRLAWYSDEKIASMLVIMSALLIYRHRENIGRLIQGKESRLGQKKK